MKNLSFTYNNLISAGGGRTFQSGNAAINSLQEWCRRRTKYHEVCLDKLCPWNQLIDCRCEYSHKFLLTVTTVCSCDQDSTWFPYQWGIQIQAGKLFHFITGLSPTTNVQSLDRLKSKLDYLRTHLHYTASGKWSVGNQSSIMSITHLKLLKFLSGKQSDDCNLFRFPQLAGMLNLLYTN